VADELPGGSWLVGAGMTALQRRGLDAATRIVERLVAATDGAGARADGGGASPWPGGLAVPGAGEVAALWRDVARALPLGRGDGPSGASGAGGAAVRLVLGSGDRAAATRLWLHNGTARTPVGVRLRCDELRDHAGATFPGTVRFAPEVLPELPAGASRPVDVTAALAGPRPRPGPGGGPAVCVFRGTIQVAGVPEAWLPVEVVAAP
jgi:hypothetical protein